MIKSNANSEPEAQGTIDDDNILGKNLSDNSLNQAKAAGSRRIEALVGYILLMSSAAFASVIVVGRPPRYSDKAPELGRELGWFLHNYGDRALAIFLIVFFSLIGLQLLGAAGKTTPRAIPSEDRALLEPLVRDANKDAISQYVILSSLGGFTGTFQKIGFSGLPLATAVLTLLFCFLSFAKPEFIEFAKLTLGAFIGSFVQRSSDTERLAKANIQGEERLHEGF
jgi:hypothetical protein